MAREAENRGAWPVQTASPRQACLRLFPQGRITRRKRSSVRLPGVSELHWSYSRLSSRPTMNRVERHDDFVRCSQLSEPAAASEALLRQTCSSRCRSGHLRFRRHHTDHSGKQRATKVLAAGRCGLIHQRDVATPFRGARKTLLRWRSSSPGGLFAPFPPSPEEAKSGIS